MKNDQNQPIESELGKANGADALASTAIIRSGPEQLDRFPRLDVLRAIAVILVFLFHYGWLTPELRRDLRATGWAAEWLTPYFIGNHGVTLFFVISGFCIHFSYLRWREKQQPNAGIGTFVPRFLWRRFARIYPPYLLALLVCFFLEYGTEITGRSLRLFAVNAAMLHNLFEVTNYQFNPAFWTIGVEWQFYAIYPLLLLGAARFGFMRFAACAGAASMLVSAIGNAWWPQTYLIVNSPFAYWYTWLAGAAIAVARVNGQRIFTHPLGLVFTLAVCLLAASGISLPLRGYGLVGPLCCSFLVEAAVFSSRPLILVERLLVPVGLCSYSVYLLHQTTYLQVLDHWVEGWHETLPSFVSWGLIPVLLFFPLLGLSWLYYRWVELPSIALGKSRFPNFLRPKRKAEALPVPIPPAPAEA